MTEHYTVSSRKPAMVWEAFGIKPEQLGKEDFLISGSNFGATDVEHAMKILPWKRVWGIDGTHGIAQEKLREGEWALFNTKNIEMDGNPGIAYDYAHKGTSGPYKDIGMKPGTREFDQALEVWYLVKHMDGEKNLPNFYLRNRDVALSEIARGEIGKSSKNMLRSASDWIRNWPHVKPGSSKTPEDAAVFHSRRIKTEQGLTGNRIIGIDVFRDQIPLHENSISAALDFLGPLTNAKPKELEYYGANLKRVMIPGSVLYVGGRLVNEDVKKTFGVDLHKVGYYNNYPLYRGILSPP